MLKRCILRVVSLNEERVEGKRPFLPGILALILVGLVLLGLSDTAVICNIFH